MSSENFHHVVGIDLGTTYSAVAVYNGYSEEAEIIRDAENEPTTPSVIGVDRVRGRVMIGWMAKRNLAADPTNTVIEIKREMGELFRPETLMRYDPNGELTMSHKFLLDTGGAGMLSSFPCWFAVNTLQTKLSVK